MPLAYPWGIHVEYTALGLVLQVDMTFSLIDCDHSAAITPPELREFLQLFQKPIVAAAERELAGFYRLAGFPDVYPLSLEPGVPDHRITSVSASFSSEMVSRQGAIATRASCMAGLLLCRGDCLPACDC